ncbi:MAG: response regulator transcription factor [Pseudomonadota bacterium]
MATRLAHDALLSAVILIVEDDKDIAHILSQYAQSHGASVHLATDGQMALMQHRQLRPDLVLLDINLPKRDGFDVLDLIRTERDTPVIIISARVEDQDKLKGLGLGADDYIVKPFNPAEVMARIKAVLHRTQGRERSPLLRYSGVELDLGSGQVAVALGHKTTSLHLTPSEYKILTLFMEAPNRVFSREDILSACFPESDALARTVDSHISHLRKKLMDAGAADLITVQRGLGYRFGDTGQ